MNDTGYYSSRAPHPDDEDVIVTTAAYEDDEDASIAERWLDAGERIAASITVCAWCLGLLVALSALNLLLDFVGWPV